MWHFPRLHGGLRMTACVGGACHRPPVFFSGPDAARDALGAGDLVGLAGGPPGDISVGWRVSLQVTSSI